MIYLWCLKNPNIKSNFILLQEFGSVLTGTKLNEVNMMVAIMARDISIQGTEHILFLKYISLIAINTY